MKANFSFRDGIKKSQAHGLSFDARCFQDFVPKAGYVIFEIMDNNQPHDTPWFGCTTVGPFKNFDQVSALGIRIEWLDQTTNE
jgi:hypothetical protein